MSEDKLKVLIRDFDVDADLNFVYNSFLKSFRGALINKKISNTVYFKNEQKILTEHIQNPEAKIIIACNPDDETQIYGYLIYNFTENSIWWAYIKEAFRRFGVFKKLLIESKLDVTKPIIYRHDSFGWTQVVNAIKDLNFVYIPFYYTI